MKGSHVKCAIFFWVNPMLDSCQKECEECNCRKITFYGVLCLLIPMAHVAFMGKSTWVVFQKSRVAHDCFNKFKKGRGEKGI